MVGFVSIYPHLGESIMGCYGKHAFRHISNKFFGGTNFLGMTGVLMSN